MPLIVMIKLEHKIHSLSMNGYICVRQVAVLRADSPLRHLIPFCTLVWFCCYRQSGLIRARGQRSESAAEDCWLVSPDVSPVMSPQHR